jgi:hypothetical protein
MRRWLQGFFLLAIASGAAAQDPQSAPYVETGEVRVRSVLVFITDSQGKALATPPSPKDLRVLEDGKPVEVLAIEPARRRQAPASPSAPTAAADHAASTAGAPDTPATVIPQYLYLDTTSVKVRTVPRIVKAVDASLDGILANGPLEIVVADPEPTVALASSSNREQIRAVLAKLPTTAVGKERIYDARKDALTRMIDAQYNSENRIGSGTYRADIRSAIRQEIALISVSTSRLDAWAATLPYDRAAVVYLCSDGFDNDLTEVYRQMLLATHDAEDAQAAMQLQNEFGREAAQVTAKASDILAGRGATAVVLALGTSDADFAMSAANIGKLSSSAITRPLNSVPAFYFNRPNEPLLTVADRTGGQVVSATEKLPQAIDTVGGAFLVTFRSQAPADGATHPLEVASAAGNLRVRAPRAVLTAPPQAASAGSAVRALSAPPAGGSLPVRVFVVDVEPAEKDRLRGRLEISVDLASIAEALEMLGPGRVRVTVAVEHSKGAPYTQSEDADLDGSGEGTLWTYESGIVWPPEANRVAVVIEELKTGARGSGTAELPKVAE